MILELDTELLSKIEHLTINQLVFLNLVLGNNQANIKDVLSLISLVNETEIQDLIDQGYIEKKVSDKAVVYLPTETLTSLIERKVTMFDEFY